MMRRTNGRPRSTGRAFAVTIGGAALLCTLLASCATTYAPFRKGEGYRDFQTSKTQYQVYFLANANTSQQTAYQFFLARAAEIALERGYPSFYVYHLKDSSRAQISLSPGSAHTTVYRDIVPANSGQTGVINGAVVTRSVTVYRPPVYTEVREPGYEGQILLVTHRLKGQAPPYDARILYREGMALNRQIKEQNRQTAIATGVGTAIVIGVSAVAAFFGSGGTISFGHVSW